MASISFMINISYLRHSRFNQSNKIYTDQWFFQVTFLQSAFLETQTRIWKLSNIGIQIIGIKILAKKFSWQFLAKNFWNKSSRSLRIQRTMYIILLNNIERADCMLLLNNETRKIIFPFPVLWFWLRRPTIQFPGSVTWSFNYCVVVYSISVTNLCDRIISLSQLVTPCYISCTWVSCRTTSWWQELQSTGIELLWLSH